MNDELIESNVSYLGHIPTKWRVTKLKRVLIEPLKYGANEAAELDDRDLPRYIRITDFGDDGNLKNDTFKSLPEQIAAEYLLEDGDVLFARSGATVGKTFLFSNYSGIACFAGYLIRARPDKKKLHSEYLYYFTKSHAYEIWKNNIFTQATIQNIGADKYQYLQLPLPSKLEQEAIARHLDKITAQIDEAIAIKQQQVAKLEQTRVSLINEVIKNGVNSYVKFRQVSREPITSIPEHYKVVKLKSVTRQIVDGTHFTPNYLEGDTSEGVPFLRITDLQNKDIDLTSTKYISPEEHKELSKRCLPEKGDLLLSKNGTIGLTKIVDWEYECSLFVSLCLIKPIKQLIDIEYLNYYFQSDYMAYQFYHESKQITVSNLHLENIRDFLIVLPPLNEQRELAQILRIKEAQFHELRLNLTKQIATLQAYRRSVIHEYVTGKKRVAAY